MVLQWAKAKEEIDLGKTLKGLAAVGKIHTRSRELLDEAAPARRTKKTKRLLNIPKLEETEKLLSFSAGE